MLVAITREVSEAIGACELSYLPRRQIVLERARLQHRKYEECLEALGCMVRRLPAEPWFPDSVFVEDAAVVLEDLAVITRPGAESRRGETVSIARALSAYRSLAHIVAPGILDGGDVLRLGHRLFVGLSRRSNQAGVEQMRRLLNAGGYTVIGVQVKNCLHLKSAVTQVAQDTLLMNPDWIDSEVFGSMRRIEVDPAEPFAANALMTPGGVVFPAAFAATRKRMEDAGINVVPVDVTELAKAEGGVTCCSLIFSAPEIAFRQS